MNKFLSISGAAVAAMALFSCSGNIDPNDDGTDGSTTGDSCTLRVDKTELEADAVSVVTFSIISPDGIDVTVTDLDHCSIFQETENGRTYIGRGIRTFSAFDNGKYTFGAMYQGVVCGNTVEVTAVNRKKYETFHRNVALYKNTGTWCSNCPDLTAGIHAMSEDIQDHVVLICCHGSGSGSTDPFAIKDKGNTYDMGNVLNSRFGAIGFPYLVLNLNVGTMNRTASALTDDVNMQRRNYPATCGLKVTSTYSNGELETTVTLKSSTGGSYDVQMALLLDDQSYPSGWEPSGIYSNILRYYTGSFYSYSSSEAIEVAADEEKSKTFKVTTTDFPELAEQPENYRIVAYAFRHLDGAASVETSTLVDNIVSCPLNSEVDYRYNE